MQLPDMPVREAILRSYGSFLAQAGGRVSKRPLVLPNGKFFPDAFTHDQPSLDRLLGRTLALASMDHVPIRAFLSEDVGGGGGGGCGSGACAPGAATSASDEPRLQLIEGTWVLGIPTRLP